MSVQPSSGPNRDFNPVRELSGLPNGQGKKSDGSQAVNSASLQSNGILHEQQESADNQL